MSYTELSKTKASLFSRLGNAKFRRKEGLFIAAGAKCVSDTLGSFTLEALLATKVFLEKNTLQCEPSLIRLADSRTLAQISGMDSSPEVIAVYRIPDTRSIEPELKGDDLVLILDGIQDPGNFGSIIRTADWFGVRKVFASKDCADIYNPKAVQATMGAISRVKAHYCDLEELIRRNPEMPVYGTLLDGENIYDTVLSKNGFVCMGNEGRGLSENIRRLVTKALLIPPYDPVSHGESLNVSAATAIVLSVFRNNR